MITNIAIDGPSGAGKSTIAKKVAKELGFVYVDTGAMYRAMAVYLIRKHVSPEDEAGIMEACQDAQIAIVYREDGQHVLLQGEDVTHLLRAEETGNMASRSSANPRVREKLVELQQQMAAVQSVVMDGRDIGSVVLPDARVKIYLTASVDVRARRRYRELAEKGEDCKIEEIRRDIEERDYRDMHRACSPLRQVEDAVYLDCSELTVEETVNAILEIYKEKTGNTWK